MNEIVITRAPRLKLIERKNIPDDVTEWYVLDAQLDIYRVRADGSQRWNSVSKMGGPCQWDGGNVYVFESFDTMCKWVSNGRRLQDLQGDVKDEWIPSGSLRHGEFYEHVHGSFMEDRGKVFLLSHSNQGGYPMMCLNSGHGHNIHQYETCMFWPLGPGDSITITNKP